MTILHVLVPAVLVFVGQSTACVEWMILNPPIIFGKTAQLLCSPLTPNISSNINNATSWSGGNNNSILANNGHPVDPNKYAEIQRWHSSKFESILHIYKFDEMDVNVNYSCTIGTCANGKTLSLTLDKFEYHPDKDTTTVLTSFRNGYLDIIMDIIKVYPIPKCTIMFNENIISRRLKTNTGVNGIFYIVVEEVEHSVGVCSGQLNVTCVVGKTEIPIHQETFNRCRKTKEESTENIVNLVISITILVLLLLILAIGMGCICKYGKLKKFLCCKLYWRRKKTTSQTNVAETAKLLITPRGSTHDAEQVENLSPVSSVNSDNDSLTAPL